MKRPKNECALCVMANEPAEFRAEERNLSDERRALFDALTKRVETTDLPLMRYVLLSGAEHVRICGKHFEDGAERVTSADEGDVP